MARQQGRKLTSTFAATRENHDAVSVDAKSSKVRRGPIVHPRSLQSRTPFLPPRRIQEEPLRRPGRMAPTRGLNLDQTRALETSSRSADTILSGSRGGSTIGPSSHSPLQKRERSMLRFRRMRSLQKFASVHSSGHNHCNLERHLNHRDRFKESRQIALDEWRDLAA